MAYTTLALCRTHMGIGASETADDALITALIPKAQQVIDTYCRRSFDGTADGDTTRYFDASRDVEGRELFLDYDLCSITQILNGDSSQTEITSSQYTTIPKNETPYFVIKLLGSSGVSWQWATDPEDAITITGKWTYSLTAPSDIVHACERLVAFMYRQKDTSQDADRPILTDAGVTILPSNLPNDVKAILAPYKRL